jgi:hypothetical protein
MPFGRSGLVRREVKMSRFVWMGRNIAHRDLDKVAVRMFPEFVKDGRISEARLRVLLLQAGYSLAGIEQELERISGLMHNSAA